MSGAGEPRGAGRWFGVFGGPIIIGVMSLAGLLSALLLGDAGRVFSWLAVGCPIGVSAWFWFRARRSANREEAGPSPF
jgi:hypothetical protein